MVCDSSYSLSGRIRSFTLVGPTLDFGYNPLVAYDQTKADAICASIAAGLSLRKACALDTEFPAPSTVCLWVLENEKFAEQYARARRLQAELLADEILEIADDGRNDMIEVEENGKTRIETNWDCIHRSRIRVDTRKWYLSKVLPKVYGDKLQTEHTGKDGGPIQFVTKSILEE